MTDQREDSAGRPAHGPAGGAAGPGPGRDSAGSRRWLVLALVGTAQLMIVLDLTVMNIALPSAQRALGFARTGADRADADIPVW